jgi:hypothetical protein
VRSDELTVTSAIAIAWKGDAPADASPRRRALLISGLLAAGTSAALIGLGAYYTHEASARADQVTQLGHLGTVWGGNGPAIEAEGHRDAVAAQALFGVAAGVGVAAGTLLILAPRVSRWSLHVAVSPKGGFLSCAGQF